MTYSELKSVLREDLARYKYQSYGERIFWGYLVWLRLTHFLASKCRRNKIFTPLYLILLIINRITSHFYQVQIPVWTQIEGGLKFAHYSGIVVAGSVTIGKNCTLHQNVTIGNGFSHNNSGHPVIGDNVLIFPGAVIVGNIRVGNHVLVTANAVVTKDVPDNSIVGGIPARVIGKYDDDTLTDFAKDLYEVH